MDILGSRRRSNFGNRRCGWSGCGLYRAVRSVSIIGTRQSVQHAKVQSAIDRVVEAVAGAQPELGIFVGDAETAKQWQDRGARYIATSLEAVSRPATLNFLAVVRPEEN